MRKSNLAPLVALAIVPALVFPASTPAQAKDGAGVALVGGLIAGAAIGAAISNSKKHPKTIYVQAPPPPPVAQPFSPKSGVTCYPAQQACYNLNGAYNANWTWKIYAH
jgi:hypothetical protein